MIVKCKIYVENINELEIYTLNYIAKIDDIYVMILFF